MDGGSESAGACHAQRGKNWWPAVAKNMLKKSRVEASWYATSASRAQLWNVTKEGEFNVGHKRHISDFENSV